MEKMQKVAAQPQLLFSRLPDRRRLARAIADVFAIPREHVYSSGVSTDGNYDLLFDQGYAILHTFETGDIRGRADVFAPSERFDDRSLHELSRVLDMPAIVDFSRTATEPEFIAYSDGKKTWRKIWEEETDSGDPAYREFRAAT